jgi:hypothetical protein
VKEDIDFSTDKERERQWLFILHEFLYFLMHMTNRTAFSVLGHEGRCRLQDELIAAVPISVVEATCGHWPADMKHKLVEEFIQNLDTAEIEYSQCKQLISESLSEDALLTKLSFHVSELAGRGRQIGCVSRIIGVANDAVITLNLRQLISSASPLGRGFS